CVLPSGSILYVHTYINYYISFINLPPTAYSVYFKITRFEPNADNILYLGDAAPSVGTIEMIYKYTYLCRVGRAIYSERVLLYDSDTGKLTNFSTHFSFLIDTQGRASYGHGLAFFLAPVGFEVPLNSVGGFLGLFNTTTSDSSHNQIVLVEFDSFPNPEWDPSFEHVGINNNSIASATYTAWNASLHSGDTADVWITYDASTKNLSVSWEYRTTSSANENTSLSFEIDLMQVLPEWVTVGFSATTGQFGERTIIQSWEFSSSLERKEKNAKNEKKKSLVIGLTVSAGVLIAIAIVTFVTLWAWKGKKKEKQEETTETMNLTSINEDLERGAGPRRFSYEYLALATNNFSIDKKLGEGGFGTVYRGYLNDLDIAVAVKKISRESKQGRKEYLAEVKIISQIRHRNLVQLVGWCHDKGEFLLVYEFMPNGSLDAHLFGKRSPLTWAVRYKIASGLASALLYLHEGWEQCVVHRDIKSSNVMLDSCFNVKLGDFGLARLMDHELSLETTGLAGTLGYMAPEYITTGRASKESDVYSYGVVALEIATGKKSTDHPEKDSAMGLVEWVWNLYGSRRLPMAIDERLGMDFEEKQIVCLMVVGLWCAHPDQKDRPSIRQALQVLNFEATMPDLPSKMPIPSYRIPTPSVSSGEPFITTSLDDGR
ncbi:L-type lectin-domain containing receptor kinase IX.1-like, partial [Juglans regia]|uniref:L-type lectin-domain containing receptor kinase IX.1-like n=1 Tax=Juglans regia TaxID=51240 RepID=A0A2I4FZF8_JUGRE